MLKRFSKRVFILTALGSLLVVGSGVAASRFMITDVHQIKPNVVAQLKGQKGSRGLSGLRGAQGAQGVKGDTGATGAAGSQGLRGDKGDKGDTGSPGLLKLQADVPYGSQQDTQHFITQSSGVVPAGKTTVVWAACPAGKVAISGGFRADSNTLGNEAYNTSPDTTNGGLQVLASEPALEDGGNLINSYNSAAQVTDYGSFVPNAWAVTVRNSGSDPANARVAILCAQIAR